MEIFEVITRMVKAHGQFDETVRVQELAVEAALEILRAMQMHGPYSSAHEGYAVILEELDELKTHVFMKQNDRDIEEMRKEAIQIAATALRFVYDVCDAGKGRV